MAKTRKLSPGMKAWNDHWHKVREEMMKKGTFKKGDGLMKVFKEAKKTFKKHKGGAEAAPEPAANEPKDTAATASAVGGSRRKTRKVRKH